MTFTVKYSLTLMLVLPLALLAGCDEEKTNPEGPYSFSWTEIRPDATSIVAVSSYTVDLATDPTIEAGVVCTQKSGGSGPVEVKAAERSGRSFTTTIRGLKPDTEYVLSPYVKAAGGTKYVGDSPRTVRTGKETEIPVPDGDIELAPATGISQTGATLNASYAIYSSEAPVSSAGFKYRRSGEESWTDVTCSSTSSPLSYELTGLDAGTKYFFTAWVAIGEYGFEIRLEDAYSFTTLSNGELRVEVSAPVVADVTETGAKFSASYTVAGSELAVSSAGFKYRKDGESQWSTVASSTALSPFSYTASGLAASTKYYVTAWAVHGGVTYESPSASATVFTTQSGGTVVSGGWAELPVKKQMSDVVYATYYVTGNGQANATPSTPGRVRNYTVCYDGARHQPLWVAYPMHSWYNGNAGRNDQQSSWIYGPYISQSIQPDLSSSYSGGYSRGHNVASSDRQKSVAMNKQTFYFSNMSPQIQNEFNGGIWLSLEDKVKALGFNCSDTLYVVTGAAFINPTRTASDKNGMKMPVPTHFYKVLLSSKTGNTKKPISQLSASELRCVGFWLNHFDWDSKAKISTNEMTTVAEIEALTGFTFFPMLSEEAKSVKTTYKASDWGM